MGRKTALLRGIKSKDIITQVITEEDEDELGNPSIIVTNESNKKENRRSNESIGPGSNGDYQIYKVDSDIMKS